MAKFFRVLALDGGGIRGIITARVLKALEDRCGAPIARLFDLIVGTSTGGLLALGLAAPADPPKDPLRVHPPGTQRLDAEPAHSAASLLTYYIEDAGQIFPNGPAPPFESEVRIFGPGGFKAWRHPVRVLWQAAENTRSWRTMRGTRGGPKTRYSPEGLERAVNRYVGDRLLHWALTDVIVTSYDMSRDEPLLFSSRARSESITQARMRDAARATSAAPTYFPPLVLRDGESERVLIDGGLYANNPTMVGYLEGSLIAQQEGRPLILVSIGTGNPNPTAPKTLRYLQRRTWYGVINQILEATLSGSGVLNDRLLQHIAREKHIFYWRIQTLLGSCSSAMDDPRQENIACLCRLADDLVSGEEKTLSAIGEMLAS